MMRVRTLAVVLAAAGVFSAYVPAQSKWVVQHRTSLLMGVDAVDSLNAWAAGGQSGLGAGIHHTSDGGKTWTRIYGGLGFAGMVLDIDMVDRKVGYAAGMGLPGMTGFGKTTDGGRTWTKQSPAVFGFLAQVWQDVFALDANHVWAVGTWVGLGQGEGVAISTTGGLFWTFVDTTKTVGTSPRYVWFVDKNTGWLASGQWPSQNNPKRPYKGVISKTTDGGKTWTNQFTVNGFYFNGLEFVDATHGWVVADGPGTTGRIFHTQDGGKTWKLQPFPDQDKLTLTGIDMLDRQEGWAVGFAPGFLGNPDVRLVHTTDGGKTWTTDPFRAPYGPLVIRMINKGRGWTVGSNNFQQGGIMMLDAEELGSYGDSTRGCRGAITLAGVGRPRLGNAAFAIRAANAPAGPAAAILGATPTYQNLLGFELLVSLNGALTTPIAGTLNLPVPASPGLVGKSLYAQSVHLSVCAPGGFAASQGLVVTVRR